MFAGVGACSPQDVLRPGMFDRRRSMFEIRWSTSECVRRMACGFGLSDAEGEAMPFDAVRVYAAADAADSDASGAGAGATRPRDGAAHLPTVAGDDGAGRIALVS